MIVTAKSIVDMLSDVDYMSKQRAGGCTPNLYAFDKDLGVFDFVTVCATSRNGWGQRIQFVNWYIEVPPEEEPLAGDPTSSWHQIKSLNPSILSEDVRVECDCPAFIWWGHHFNLDQEDATFFHQPFPPDHNDPLRERKSCKHLIAVYNFLFG